MSFAGSLVDVMPPDRGKLVIVEVNTAGTVSVMTRLDFVCVTTVILVWRTSSRQPTRPCISRATAGFAVPPEIDT